MEGALARMSELCRQKGAEVEALKRTVTAECDERVRLLATVQQLQAQLGGGAAHAVAPPEARRAPPSPPGPSKAPSIKPAAWPPTGPHGAGGRQPARRRMR